MALVPPIFSHPTRGHEPEPVCGAIGGAHLCTRPPDHLEPGHKHNHHCVDPNVGQITCRAGKHGDEYGNVW